MAARRAACELKLKLMGLKYMQKVILLLLMRNPINAPNALERADHNDRSYSTPTQTGQTGSSRRTVKT